MSNITQVILTCPPAEEELEGDFLDAINCFGFPQRTKFAAQKSMICELLIGCFRQLDIEALMDHLSRFPWQLFLIAPADVQLLIQQEEASRFTVCRLTDTGQWEVDRQGDVDACLSQRIY